jgi:hypothetical protein
MGISILEPPLSRSILLCDRARFAVAGEACLRNLPFADDGESFPVPGPAPGVTKPEPPETP